MRPSIISLGRPRLLGLTCSGQRFIASIASEGLSATCPSASMIRMRTPLKSVLALKNPNRVLATARRIGRFEHTAKSGSKV
jgi:hypothetical protein